MYSTWMRAEQFYTTILPVLAIVTLLITGIFLFALSYTEKGQKKRKYFTIGFSIFIVIGLSYSIGGHVMNSFWVEQNAFINPGIREFSYILGMRTDEDQAMVRTYRRAPSLPEHLSSLEMYDSERIVREFDYEYLGSTDNNHFFTFGDENQYIMHMQGDITWGNDTKELVGYQYRLNDERFEEIGFHTEYEIIFDHLALPDEEYIRLDSAPNNDLTSVTEMVIGWNFGRQFY